MPRTPLVELWLQRASVAAVVAMLAALMAVGVMLYSPAGSAQPTVQSQDLEPS